MRPVVESKPWAWLEWIRAAENYCAVGPAGTGKSHSLVAFGVAAVTAGRKVRYFTAAELVETLYRGLADNSVGRVIENLLRNDLVIIDEVGFDAKQGGAARAEEGHARNRSAVERRFVYQEYKRCSTFSQPRRELTHSARQPAAGASAETDLSR